MLIDAATLALAGGFITHLSGLFLLVYWSQDRKTIAALWWALANCGLGIGICLLALQPILPFLVSHVIAPLLLDLCAVLAFVAARVVNRRSINPYALVPAVVIWLTILMITGALAREQFAVALGVATSGLFYMAAAFQFWLGRSEPLRGRKPIIVLIMAHAIALLMIAVNFAFAHDYNPLPSVDWFGAVHFVGLGYSVGVTFFLTVMLKDRSEEQYKVAGFTDPLTGLANRRAFMDQSRRIFLRGDRDRSPVALIAFDLDRFKHINDTLGHASGDQVLRCFSDVLRATLRPSDHIARIGGEEFVAVLPGVGNEAAMVIARRASDAFQKAGQFVNGQKIDATVSAGVATTGGLSCDVETVLANADAALYRAKKAGRNRVVLSETNQINQPVNNVVRIA